MSPQQQLILERDLIQNLVYGLQATNMFYPHTRTTVSIQLGIFAEIVENVGSLISKDINSVNGTYMHYGIYSLVSMRNSNIEKSVKIHAT